MLFGSVPPAEEAQVLDQYPVGQAQHGEGDQPEACQPPAAAEERGADRRQGHHRDQVDRESVGLVKGPERGDPPG